MRKFLLSVIFIVGCISAPTKERISTYTDEVKVLKTQLAAAIESKSTEVEALKAQLATTEGKLEEAKAQGRQERVESGAEYGDAIIKLVEPFTRGIPYAGTIFGALSLLFASFKKK